MVEVVRTAATIEHARAVDFAARAFAATGVPEEQARKAADALVDADLHGTVTHGMKNLRRYVNQLLRGDINPRAQIREISGGKAARVLDADNALGHVAGHAGMEKAIELAKEYGVGTCFVRGSNHYGASGYWARLALKHNMVGFAFTSATAAIAPWGGREPVVGNNPPSWAIPTHLVGDHENLSAGEADSLFLDIALSVVAGNRMDIYKRRGEQMPPGWALGADGEPTTDPDARSKGGTFAPLGEYKGSGMAIVLAAISCFLTGEVFDDQRGFGDAQKFGTCTHWFQAYDIAQFRDPAAFTTDVAAMRERVRSVTPRAGVERVYAPGDIENEKAQRYLRQGIPYEQFTLDDMAWVAEHTGIEYNIV